MTAAHFTIPKGTHHQPTWSLRLKDDTKTAHKHAEAAVAPLLSKAINLTTYRSHLRKIALFMELHEPILLHAVQEDPWLRTLDYSSRMKLDALYKDETLLAPILGTSPTPKTIFTHQTRHNAPSVPLTTTAQRFGFLYVLEGSTLGGLIISKKLESNLNLSQIGGIHFFNIYGDQTRSKWEQFVRTLNAYCDANPTLYPTVVRSALETFQCYQRILQSPDQSLTNL